MKNEKKGKKKQIAHMEKVYMKNLNSVWKMKCVKSLMRNSNQFVQDPCFEIEKGLANIN